MMTEVNVMLKNSFMLLQQIEEDTGVAPEPFKRTADDLRMYDNFFPELFEIEVMKCVLHNC